jgi:hypothetical protein
MRNSCLIFMYNLYKIYIQVTIIFPSIFIGGFYTEFQVRFWRVLTMVYNTENYCVLGLCPSSGILEARKHNVSETGSVSVLRWGGEDTYSVGSLRTNFTHSMQWLRLAPGYSF